MNEDEGPVGYELSGDELRDTIAKTPEQRYAYFVDKCVETGQVWTVGAGEELIVLATEDEEPFVVAFPHPQFAEDWFSATDLDDVDLVAVHTDDWAKEILPGLHDAEIDILVFPTSEGTGSLTDAQELAKTMLGT
jgi:hypothetical protein